MKRCAHVLFVASLAAVLTAPLAASAAIRGPLVRQPVNSQRIVQPDAGPSSVLKHIVIIIQENRSMDNLFNGFCVNKLTCADTVTVDPVTGTQLVPESLAAPFDPFHDRASFVIEYDKGKMDGFSKNQIVCNGSCPYTVFSYVPLSETQIYQDLATKDGVLADRVFQTDQAPTFPSHYYAIAGQSGGYTNSDHSTVSSGSGSCKTQTVVKTVLINFKYPGKAGPNSVSCQEFPTIFDLLVAKGHTWRYYSDSQAGFFSAPQAVQHLYGSPNFIVPSRQFLTDVANGDLADVTYVMPDSEQVSDHPGVSSDPTAGPNWVASLVNAIGETPFWNDTAIVLWWDDWGGWFDHVRPGPPQGTPGWMNKPDPFEYGFRVPLVVISAYAKRNIIDHTQRSFVGALRLIEETFHTASLNTTDVYEPDGLNSMFNFKKKPSPYVPVGGSAAMPFRRLRY